MKRFHLACLGVLLTLPGFACADSSIEYSTSRGGRLYDKWFKEADRPSPKAANPAYPDTGKYKGKKASDWRCKECHGWDYKGRDGIYAKGKHFTGVAGVLGSDAADHMQRILRDANHGYGEAMLDEHDARDLANFLRHGVIDMAPYIDSTSGDPVDADAARGQVYYETVCANCHGLDGKAEDTAPPLGKVARSNPWEVLHKIVNGQPGAEMPSMRAFDMQVSLDLVKYLRTLPAE
ncbi:MAG: hypothetical protein B0D87_01425 [Candidatus Sedimenticola endophacoides]|nr:MAG: hypothetical protein B0D94_00545 [Candidatus Sedimenticola endophacoides]OQX49235.1 MAG: hypothetical protein B0D87_01425 [Candidatus Sedimenticola endophacoides]